MNQRSPHACTQAHRQTQCAQFHVMTVISNNANSVTGIAEFVQTFLQVNLLLFHMDSFTHAKNLILARKCCAQQLDVTQTPLCTEIA